MYFYWLPNEAKSQFCDELPMPTNALVDRDTSGIVKFVVEIPRLANITIRSK